MYSPLLLGSFSSVFAIFSQWKWYLEVPIIKRCKEHPMILHEGQHSQRDSMVNKHGACVKWA